MPLNALLVTLSVLLHFSLVNIGSTVALQATITIGTSGLITTYLLSVGCVLLRRVRCQPLPPRRWSLDGAPSQGPVSHVANDVGGYGGHRSSSSCTRFGVGWLGVAVDALALAFMLPFLVFSFFPAATPVRDMARMNWSCAVYGGELAAGTVYYVMRGRRSCTPPVAFVRRGD